MSLKPYTSNLRVAYFSMEIALQPEIPTYSGGLGILAGDTLRSAADLELNMVGVTLVSRAGYFQQEIDSEGRQTEQADWWRPEDYASALEAKITVSIEGRSVWVGGWIYILRGHTNGREPVILLDTDLAENNEEDRKVTNHLYGGDESYRLKQEIVLGVGGIRMLQALGFRIFHHHMNEGHSALLALELLHRNSFADEDLRAGETPYLATIREQCSFTTHTPVEAGHDKFHYDLVGRMLTDFSDLKLLKKLAGEDRMNMTRLALNLSETINGVTKRHAQVSRKIFPEYAVRAINNGVHPATWTCKPMAELFDSYFPGWQHEPELLVRADCCLPDELIWNAHGLAKQHLLEGIEKITGQRFDPTLPVLGFARRMTAYKRPDLLFSDIDRLAQLAREHPFQIVLAGKAHPADHGGKRLIENLHNYMRQLKGVVSIAFLPNYSMATAQALVAGVDVWLNTPMQPLEASGTSGMKAAFNGVPSLSVLDGWWIEGCIEGLTGWAVGEANQSDAARDAESLYHKLEHVVLPMYSQRRDEWIKVMKGSISKNAAFFNSHRMMRRYVTEAYIR
ncbi:alpha-glucan family phosphorylase [Proteobacteria bacterium 005FR1]|nr:alpha-glucan family phosphorylase [Proteobacteria bacterium 005FR1]